jgi:hypothetical protein
MVSRQDRVRWVKAGRAGNPFGLAAMDGIDALVERLAPSGMTGCMSSSDRGRKQFVPKAQPAPMWRTGVAEEWHRAVRDRPRSRFPPTRRRDG